MSIIFIILIIVAAVVLSLFVLIQNPKGGGLAGNIAGFSNQFMGVKQTTDVLEKGTWIFAAAVGLLCLFSVIFIPKATTAASPDSEKGQNLPVPAQKNQAPATNPGTTVPMPGTTPNTAPATTPGTTPASTPK
jgi:preprotein translocase subunit SecG